MPRHLIPESDLSRGDPRSTTAGLPGHRHTNTFAVRFVRIRFNPAGSTEFLKPPGFRFEIGHRSERSGVVYNLRYIVPLAPHTYAWPRLRCSVRLAENSRIKFYAKLGSTAGSQSTNEALVVIGPGYEAPESVVMASSCPEYGRTIGLDGCRGKMARAATTSQYAAGH
jgi:hypothetical protein